MKNIKLKRTVNSKLSNFKMYKSGKQWIFSSMILISLGIGGAIAGTAANIILQPQQASAATLPNQSNVLLGEKDSTMSIGAVVHVQLYGSTDANGNLDATKSVKAIFTIPSGSFNVSFPVYLINPSTGTEGASQTASFTTATQSVTITFPASEVKTTLGGGGRVTIGWYVGISDTIEFDIYAPDENGNAGNSNSGSNNSGDNNTGNSNTGSDNSGDNNTGNSNVGSDNSGDSNTGNSNTGSNNSGDNNTGNSNAGSDNSGDNNTGNSNTGSDNSGDNNTGNSNAGTD
ncbi:hypothetical protein ESZ50_01975, partial [Weissella muntiaci]